MEKRPGIFARVWQFYRDGFRNMTWGRPLVWLILLKLIILFGILRIFFFKPVLQGLSEEEKSETVGRNITQTPQNQTLNLLTE